MSRFHKKLIIIVLTIMIIGFATLTTTFFFNGTVSVRSVENNYDVYYSNAFINGNEDKSVIKDKTHIYFETTLKSMEDTYVIDYEVTNASRNLDSKLTINCTSSNDYLIIVNTFDTESVLLAQHKRMGKLKIELQKLVTENISFDIQCDLVADAKEQNEEDESTTTTTTQTEEPTTTPLEPDPDPEDPTLYTASFQILDNNNDSLSDSTVVVFSEEPHILTPDLFGNFYVENLPAGNHEVYIVNNGNTVDSSMSKDDIIAKSVHAFDFNTTDKKIINDNDDYNINFFDVDDDVSINILKVVDINEGVVTDTEYSVYNIDSRVNLAPTTIVQSMDDVIGYVFGYYFDNFDILFDYNVVENFGFYPDVPYFAIVKANNPSISLDGYTECFTSFEDLINVLYNSKLSEYITNVGDIYIKNSYTDDSENITIPSSENLDIHFEYSVVFSNLTAFTNNGTITLEIESDCGLNLNDGQIVNNGEINFNYSGTEGSVFSSNNENGIIVNDGKIENLEIKFAEGTKTGIINNGELVSFHIYDEGSEVNILNQSEGTISGDCTFDSTNFVEGSTAIINYGCVKGNYEINNYDVAIKNYNDIQELSLNATKVNTGIINDENASISMETVYISSNYSDSDWIGIDNHGDITGGDLSCRTTYSCYDYAIGNCLKNENTASLNSLYGGFHNTGTLEILSYFTGSFDNRGELNIQNEEVEIESAFFRNQSETPLKVKSLKVLGNGVENEDFFENYGALEVSDELSITVLNFINEGTITAKEFTYVGNSNGYIDDPYCTNTGTITAESFWNNHYFANSEGGKLEITTANGSSIINNGELVVNGVDIEYDDKPELYNMGSSAVANLNNVTSYEVHNEAVVNIYNSSIVYDEGDNYEDAVLNLYGESQIEGSIFGTLNVNEEAEVNLSGVYIDETGSANFENCTVNGEFPSNRGTIIISGSTIVPIYSEGGTIEITNSTIGDDSNITDTAIYNYYTEITIDSCTIYGSIENYSGTIEINGEDTIVTGGNEETPTVYNTSGGVITMNNGEIINPEDGYCLYNEDGTIYYLGGTSANNYDVTIE